MLVLFAFSTLFLQFVNADSRNDTDFFNFDETQRVVFSNSSDNLLEGQAIYVSGSPVTSARAKDRIVKAELEFNVTDSEPEMPLLSALQYKLKHSLRVSKKEKLNSKFNSTIIEKARKRHKKRRFTMANATEPVFLTLKDGEIRRKLIDNDPVKKN